MKPRISMITLGVRDLPAAVRFYEQGLGFPRKPAPPAEASVVAFFTLRGSWLALFGRADLPADAHLPAGQPDAGREAYGGFALAHNVDSPAAVDALLAQAKAAGAQITRPGGKTDWGGYAGYFRDLDGHLWEVAWNPHFRVGPGDED